MNDPKMAIAKQEAKQIILRPNLIVMLMVMMMNYDSVAGDCNYDEDYDIFFSKHFLNVFDAFVTLLIFLKKKRRFCWPKGGGTGVQRFVPYDDDGNVRAMTNDASGDNEDEDEDGWMDENG